MLRPLEQAFDGVLLRRSASPYTGQQPVWPTIDPIHVDVKPARSVMEQIGDEPVQASRFFESVDQVAGLLLDGLIEARFASNWTSGSAAASHLMTGQPTSPRTRLGELSERAIRLAASARPAGILEVTKLLYRYNTVAASRAVPAASSTHDFLGLERPDVRALLSERWPAARTAGDGHPWFSWSDPHSPGAKFKLYVSPELQAVPDAFRAVVRESHDRSAPFMKVGSTFFNLLRPDKFVLYFANLSDLMATAARLRPVLAGLPAQGVPFTGQLSDDGLLSWGVDPRMQGTESQSWRLLVARRLADSLVRYREDSPDVQAWQFALARLEVDGIDSDRWTLRKYESSLS